MAEQEKIMRDEQFKSTFFNLLAEQRDLLHSLKATYNGLSLKDVTKQISAKVCGQEFFDMAIVELKFLFHSLELENYEPYDTEYAEELMQNVYDQCFRGEFLPERLKKENEKNVRSAKRYINSLFFREIFNITKDDFLKYKEIKSESDKITFVYDKYFSKRENSGCYFRHLYRILSFIEDTEKQEIRKSNQNQQQIEKHYYEYAQFVQAQMSTSEMVVVYYNSFSFPNLKRLLVKYNLLENLTIENLLNPKHYCCNEFNMKHRPEYRWNQ